MVRCRTRILSIISSLLLLAYFTCNIRMPKEVLGAFHICRPFLHNYTLVNLTDIVREIIEKGSTNTKPINTIYSEYQSLYSRSCKQETSLIIMVKSYVGNVLQRKAIRETWGNNRKETVQIVFVLGFSEKYSESVKEEYNKYGDIIQGSFLDIYENNIYKTHMAFDWVSSNCLQIEWGLFVDDDYFVNIPNIQKYISTTANLAKNAMFGHKECNDTPIRKKNKKWYLTTEEYPYDIIPPFLSGGSVLTHISVIRKLRLAFPFCKRLWLDDVFVSLVAMKLNIDLINEPNFVNPDIKDLDVKNRLSNHFFKTPESLYQAWMDNEHQDSIARKLI